MPDCHLPAIVYFDSEPVIEAAGWFGSRPWTRMSRKRFRKAARMARRRVGIMAIRCTRIAV